MFYLPSQTTLKALLNKTPLNCGLNDHVFNMLMSVCRKRENKSDNMCGLIFDEMSIRKNVSHNLKKDCIDGFQDHGNHGQSSEIATHALVFMVAGIRKRWKQPVAYYLSGDHCTTDRATVLVKEVLGACLDAGLNVLATVCDRDGVNVKVLDKLGSTDDHPYFDFEGQQIVTVLDVPHLLKCMRNLAMKYDVRCKSNITVEGKSMRGTAKWEHIKKFYEVDNSNPNFVYGYRLTQHHLNPNSKQKMTVKLAAQVFSHSVAGGMFARVAQNELPVEALTTATFLELIDMLFDSWNADSSDLRGGKKFSTNLTKKSPHLKFWEDMKMFISDLEYINITRTPPSQKGWIRSINAVKKLWQILHTQYKIDALATRRLNQDPLENTFSSIRAKKHRAIVCQAELYKGDKSNT